MPQAYVVYLAIVAAIASLLLTSWKIWVDRELARTSLRLGLADWVIEKAS